MNFSLGFDSLLSCVYVESWPQLIMTFKGFNSVGQQQILGYAQMFLPTETGKQHINECYIFSIIKNVKWYQKWFPFIPKDFAYYDEKDF